MMAGFRALGDRFANSVSHLLLLLLSPRPRNTAEGYYAFIRAYGRKSGEVATLLSPPLQESSCFSFFYHVYGFDVNEVKVQLGDAAGDKMATIWSHKGSLDDRWLVVLK